MPQLLERTQDKRRLSGLRQQAHPPQVGITEPPVGPLTDRCIPAQPQVPVRHDERCAPRHRFPVGVVAVAAPAIVAWMLDYPGTHGIGVAVEHRVHEMALVNKDSGPGPPRPHRAIPPLGPVVQLAIPAVDRLEQRGVPGHGVDTPGVVVVVVHDAEGMDGEVRRARLLSQQIQIGILVLPALEDPLTVVTPPR